LDYLSRSVGAGDRNSPRPIDVRTSIEHLNLVLAHQKLDTFGELEYYLALAFLRLNEVQRSRACDYPVFFSVFKFVEQIRGMKERLGWDAPAQKTSAAEVLVFLYDCGS
jgi:hypothetical protein